MSGLVPPNNFISGEMPAPAGTRIAFNQPSAPLGWVTDTSAALSDCSPRTMTDSSGGATGGSTAWSSWNFGGVFNINNFTISLAQMPTHNHGMSSTHSHGPSDGRDYLGVVGSGTQWEAGGGGNVPQQVGTSNAVGTGVTLQNNGSGAAVGTTITTPQIKFTDLIICQKS